MTFKIYNTIRIKFLIFSPTFGHGNISNRHGKLLVNIWYNYYNSYTYLQKFESGVINEENIEVDTRYYKSVEINNKKSLIEW